MTELPREEAMRRIATYENRDERCGYPFTMDPLGYCWSYATHVDVMAGRTEDADGRWRDMESICSGCDLWKPNQERSALDA